MKRMLQRSTLQALFAQALVVMLTTLWVNSVLETPESQLLQIEEYKHA